MIIPSLLWTDFYKLTMGQAVIHQCPGAWVKFKFKCRNGTALPFANMADNVAFVDDIREEITGLCTLRFRRTELDYIRGAGFFKPDYLEFLRLLQLNRDYVYVGIENGELVIVIEGPWMSTIWFEIPVLLIVSTLYNKYRTDRPMEFSIEKDGMKKLEEKVSWLNSNLHQDASFYYADFGTRRAWSPTWHERVLRYLIENTKKQLVGTSNVFLAMKYGIKPIGTMAHEWFQGWQQLGPRLVDAQRAALQAWADEYRGELGIALSDIVGFDAFCKDFDRYFALLFDGCRHDSGDPAVWCEKLIGHYEKLRIDPRTKTAVFSDGLTFQIAVRLYEMFNKEIKTSFGIGTHLTNDVGVEALQLVIKMVECNHKPVAKLPDSTGKTMCEDEQFLFYLKKVYDIRR